MIRRKRSRSRLVALVVMAFAVASLMPIGPAVALGDVSPMADYGDDIGDASDLAAVGSPFSDALDAGVDTDDVFFIDLTAGQYLIVDLTGASGTNFDINVFGPTATSVTTDQPLKTSATDTYPEKMVFRAPADGTYHLDLWAYQGSGAYTCTWSIVAGSADDDIPGVPIPTSPVNGSFSTITDWRDVYSVPLVEDQYLELTLTGDAGTDFDLYLWSPDATSVVNVGITPYVAGSSGQGSSESIAYLCPPGGGGTYYVEVYDFNSGTIVAGGDYTLTWKKTMPDVARLFGLTRYQTSLSISRSNFKSATSVVFATGRNYPDALAASGLAGVLDCPVILLPPLEAVPFETLSELFRLGVKDAYIVGGTGVVHEGIDIDLEAAGYSVKRLAGATRYDTSKAVADEMVTQGATPGTAFLVSGRSFADALSVAPYAFNQGFPILLTQPTTLVWQSQAFIEANGIDNVVIAGGTGAVSAGVASAVDGLRSGAVTVHREGGLDRYATAAMVAKYSIDTKGWATWDYIGVATGATFPDALSGGAACGTRGGGLLLTRPTSLPNVTKSAIEDNSGSIDMTLLFGGTGAVSDGVKADIEAAMQ